jgi:hypothetical protein
MKFYQHMGLVPFGPLVGSRQSLELDTSSTARAGMAVPSHMTIERAWQSYQALVPDNDVPIAATWAEPVRIRDLS